MHKIPRRLNQKPKRFTQLGDSHWNLEDISGLTHSFYKKWTHLQNITRNAGQFRVTFNNGESVEIGDEQEGYDELKRFALRSGVSLKQLDTIPEEDKYIWETDEWNGNGYND
jgi:hypothetical protein